MEQPRSATLEDRLETLGWAFLFLLVAAIALPRGQLQQVSVTGIGVLILGLNAVRARVGVEASWFGIALGGSCTIAGLAALAGLHPDLLVVFFVLAGLVNVAAALRPRAIATE